MGPETLLFFSYLLILGSVVAQTNYCPPQSVFDNTLPVVCSSFGTGHVHTWDGSVYDFHEYGDFYLVNAISSSGFSVQIRQIDCQTTKTQAVPITTTTEFSATCVQTYAITTTSGIVQFNHNLNSDYLNVTVNGVAQPPQSTGTLGGVGWLINPVFFTNPYKSWHRDSLDFMPDADFVVTFNGAPGTSISIRFFSSGYSSITLSSTSSSVQGWAGLCGYADGCAANDLTLSNTPSEPLPYGIDASKFLATSTGANAGTLPANRQFVNNTKDPNSWVPYFGSSWRVGYAALAFTTPTLDRYNIRLTKTQYPASQTGCDWPSQWDIPSFISSACAEDNAAGSDPDGFDQFPAKTILRTYCDGYCTTGVFPFRNPALQAHQCNGQCQYPKGVTDPELHATYNNVTFPPYSLQYSTESMALFTSKLSLGGTYTFNLMTNDSCQARAYNITRSIQCTNTLSVNSFQSTPSTFVARNHWYNFPLVCITATVPAGLVRASWMAVAWPGMPATSAPTLSDPLSFVPCFFPSNPGNYTFELAVYDGCQIKKQNLTIVAECSSCPSASIIGFDNVKEVLWGLDFNSAANGISKSATATYPTKTFIARSQSQDWPTYAALNYAWTVMSDDDSRDVVTSTPGSSTYTVSRYPDASVNAFAMMNPSGVVLNSTTGPWTTVYGNTSVNLAGFSLPPLTGPVGTTYGVYPPQREFTIVRSFTIEQHINASQSTAYNVTYVHQAIPPTPRCTLAFPAATVNTSTTTLSTTSALTGWNYGAGCTGEYNVQLQVAEAYCQNATDVQKVVVDCGPVPEVYAACESRVQYNYGGRAFPTVVIDASRSLDVYGRTLTLLYTIVPPAGSTTAVNSLLPANCGTTGCTNLAPTFVPDVDGQYLIQVQASTSCNSNAVNASVIAWCNGTSQQVNAQWATVSGQASFTYAGTPASQQIALTAAASTTDAVGSHPTYIWTVQYVPSPFFGVAVAAPSFDNPVSMTPTLTATVPGPYQITLQVNQGCNQSSINVQNITMVCPNTVTASITGPATINVAYPWTTTTLTSGSTSTPGGTLVNTWRLHDLNLNTTTPLGTGATMTVNPPVYGARAGTRTFNVEEISGEGCQYANASVQITYQCFAMTINIVAVGPNVLTGTVVTLDASTSVVPGPPTAVTYSWVLTSVPADLQTTSPTITNAAAPIATITPTWHGTYTIVLTISDGCTTLNQTVTFNVNCNSGGIAFSPTATPASLIWNATAFQQVALAANFAAKNNSLTYTYRWRVLSAPALSIFYPNSTMTSLTTNTTAIPPTIIADVNNTGYQFVVYNMTLVQTNVTYSNWTVLPNSVADSQSIFPSCFYPDLPGTYTLELFAQDTCQAATQTVSVSANCAAAAPTIALQVTEHANFNSSLESHYVNASGSNAWTVSLSRAAPRRVVLDARGSSSTSNSHMTYYWGWASPDPRYNTTLAQDQIETPYASTAALLLNRGGTYHLNLVVHDGCSWSILNFTITATCSEPQSTLTLNAIESVDGSQYYTFALSFAKGDNQTLCSSNQWQMSNFSTAAVNAATPHSTTSLPLLFSLVSLFALLHF